MTYKKNAANPVFLVRLVDSSGAPVTGITAPTVTLSKSQAANTTTVPWVEDTDFTWHELTGGEACKGCYKLRQKDAPNVSAVDTVGACLLHVHKTAVATASAVVAYDVDAALQRLVEVLTTDRVIDRDTGVQSFYNEAGTVVRYTSTPSTPTAVTSKDTIAEA